MTEEVVQAEAKRPAEHDLIVSMHPMVDSAERDQEANEECERQGDAPLRRACLEFFAREVPDAQVKRWRCYRVTWRVAVLKPAFGRSDVWDEEGAGLVESWLGDGKNSKCSIDDGSDKERSWDINKMVSRTNYRNVGVFVWELTDGFEHDVQRTCTILLNHL